MFAVAIRIIRERSSRREVHWNWRGNVTCPYFLVYFSRLLLLLQQCLSSGLPFVSFSAIHLTFCGLFSGQQSFLCSDKIPQILLSTSYVVNICDFYGLCLGFKFSTTYWYTCFLIKYCGVFRAADGLQQKLLFLEITYWLGVKRGALFSKMNIVSYHRAQENIYSQVESSN